MAKNGNVKYYAAAVVVFLLFCGWYYGAFAQWGYPGPSQPGPTPGTPDCSVYGSGYTWNGQVCVPPAAPPVAPSVYYGTVNYKVTFIDGDSKAAITMTNAILWVMHADGSFEGAVTDGDEDVDMAQTDAGQMQLVLKYMTCTVGFVDPPRTRAQNPSYMKQKTFLKDVDNNGQFDQVYPLDLSHITIGAGQTKPTVKMQLITWNDDETGLDFVEITAPTGMTVAGDYHATGYLTGITETYAITIARVYFKSNTTASTKFGDEFAAGTVVLKALRLSGTGAQTGTVHGKQWLKQDFVNPTYDAAQDLWDVYKATGPDGKVDSSQVNYGMLVVYEKMSGASWFTYDIWLWTSSGAMTASATYLGFLEMVTTNPAGTQVTTEESITFTG